MGTIFHEPDASEPAERDARITPTPDRGTLGIGSESHTEGPGPQAGSQQAFGQKQLEAGQPGLSVPQIRALAAAGALAGCGSTSYFDGRTLPPSGLVNRVAIAIQNPGILAKGAVQIVI